MVRNKHTSTDARIRSLVEDRVRVLANEIASEIAREIANELTSKVTATVQPAPEGIEQDFEPMLLVSYDRRSRKWGCPHCKNYSDLRRRAVTAHARFCQGLTALVVPVVPAPPTQQRAKSRKKNT